MDSTTCTYLIDEPFPLALKHLRMALSDANLNITGELDLAHRLHKALVLSLPPCVLLFTSFSERSGEDLNIGPYVAAMIPLHVVVSSRGRQTEVHLLRLLPRIDVPADPRELAVLGRLQGAILRAVDGLGMRYLGT